MCLTDYNNDCGSAGQVSARQAGSWKHSPYYLLHVGFAVIRF